MENKIFVLNMLEEVLCAKPAQRKVGAEFCTFAGSLTIRSWQPKDRAATELLVKTALEEHGLNFDPLDTDKDLVYPEKYYEPCEGEMWILEKHNTVVGCAAFLPIPDTCAVEFRKMYFSPSIRGSGYGKLILGALEYRAFELGYREGRLETSHLLEAACKLYEKMGYMSCSQIHSPRCNRAYTKDLTQQFSSDHNSCNSNKDYIYWLDTQGRLFSLLKTETAVRFAVLLKQWRFAFHTRNSKIGLFPCHERQKIYQCFLWSTENLQLRNWLTDLNNTYSGVFEITVSKSLHIFLPRLQQHVVVQVIKFVLDDSSLPMLSFVDLNALQSNEIDEDDYCVWKEFEL